MRLRSLSAPYGLWGSGRADESPETEPDPADSEAGRRLQELTYQYLQGKSRGRFALIGGRAGIGKTWVLRHALERGWKKHLKDQNKQDAEPLIIPLSGPALLRIPPPSQEGPAVAEELFKMLVLALHEAVLHRMIRALSEPQENLSARKWSERAEIAEQLRIDMLRSDIDLARTRSRWEHAGALPHGLLFPKIKQMRGFREVSVIWGLTQIHMIVTGTYEKKRNMIDEASQERRSQWQTTMQGKEILNPLLGLLSGGLLAAGTFGTSPFLSAVVAVVGAIGSTTVLNLSTERILKGSKSDNIEFTENLGIQSLSRWLPHLLQHVREIGLYPVFVIDDLDKGEENLTERLEGLIRQIKGGLFDSALCCCVVGEEAYKNEKVQSMFTDKLYVSFQPAALRRYVVDLLDDSDTSSLIHWKRWAAILVYRAEASPSRLRQLLEVYGPDSPICKQQQLTEGPCREEIFLELCLEQTLAMEDMAAVLHRHPERLADVLHLLHYPLQCRVDGRLVETTQDAVKTCLNQATADPHWEKIALAALQLFCKYLAGLQPLTEEFALLAPGQPPLLKSIAPEQWSWVTV